MRGNCRCLISGHSLKEKHETTPPVSLFTKRAKVAVGIALYFLQWNCLISNIIPTLLRPEASFRLRRCVQFAGNLEGSPTTAYLTARTSSNTSARGALQMAQRTRNLGSSSPTRRESVGMADGKKFQPS